MAQRITQNSSAISASGPYMLGSVYIMTHSHDLAGGIEGPEVQFLIPVIATSRNMSLDHDSLAKNSISPRFVKISDNLVAGSHPTPKRAARSPSAVTRTIRGSKALGIGRQRH